MCVGPIAPSPNSFIISGCVLASFGLLSFLLFSPRFHGKQQHMQTHMALLICSPLNERENGETRRTRVPSASCVGQYTSEDTFCPLNLSFPQSHIPLSGRHKSHGRKRRLATSDIKTTRRLKFMISRRAMPHKWKAN